MIKLHSPAAVPYQSGENEKDETGMMPFKLLRRSKGDSRFTECQIALLLCPMLSPAHSIPLKKPQIPVALSLSLGFPSKAALISSPVGFLGNVAISLYFSFPYDSSILL